MISVVIVSSHNVSLASQCLASLKEAYQAVSQVPMELIIGAYDETRVQVLEQLIKQIGFTNFKTAVVQRDTSIPLNRNSLLQLADPKSEWILFIDDDVELPRDFFVNFQRLLKQWPQAAIFGGPNLTPPRQSGLAKASGTLFGSRLNFLCRQRYCRGQEGQRTSPTDFILCNLFVRTNIQPRFRSEFPLGEELVLIKDFIHQGYDCVYSPDLAVYHFRREQFGQILIQMQKYGRGRGMAFKFHSILLLTVLLPFLFFISPLLAWSQITMNSDDTEISPANWLRMISLIPAQYAIGLTKGLFNKTEPSHAKPA